MGVYMPQFAKDSKPGDTLKNREDGHVLTILKKVGPLQGQKKHGFISTAGIFWAWDSVEPLDGLPEKQEKQPRKLTLDDVKVGDKVMLHRSEKSDLEVIIEKIDICRDRNPVIVKKENQEDWSWSCSLNKDDKGYSDYDGYITLIKKQPNPKPQKTVPNPKTPAITATGSGILETMLDNVISERFEARFKHYDTAIESMATPRKLEIVVNDKPPITVDTPHFKLEKLLSLIGAGQDVYMHGGAGTGKSTAAHQCATALTRSFAYTSLCPQSSETLLFGFNHAGGGYVETDFYRSYRDGGVFCLDEMDNGSAALLNKLNSLLENGHGSFPCGMVARHKDFVLVATGNTNGNGASLEFPDRRAFDPAFKERFAFLEWPLDEKQERLIALSINPEKAIDWLDTVKSIRKAVVKLNIERVLVTPRATFKGLRLINAGFEEAEILDMVIFKGCGTDAVKQIKEEAGL